MPITMTIEKAAILQSIKGEWWEKIIDKQKIFEVRKTCPNNPLIRKMLPHLTVYVHVSGKEGIIGQYTCSRIIPFTDWHEIGSYACLTKEQLREYGPGKDGFFYRWSIRDPKEYSDPIPLSAVGVNKVPQSWCYCYDHNILLVKEFMSKNKEEVKCL